MINTLLGKIIGTQNERELKRLRPLVGQINDLESGVTSLSDTDLRARTETFKARLANGETLDDILPEAFAVVREAGRRVLICVTSTCSSSAAWCCTPGASLK